MAVGSSVAVEGAPISSWSKGACLAQFARRCILLRMVLLLPRPGAPPIRKSPEVPQQPPSGQTVAKLAPHGKQAEVGSPLASAGELVTVEALKAMAILPLPAFVKGDAGEAAQEADLSAMVQAAARGLVRAGGSIALDIPPEQKVRVKPNAFGRLLANLIGNAARYARNVSVTASVAGHTLRLLVDDDGPGIPPDKREEAFRPFVRLDHARNLDETGTGLGLAIARDIAHAHGGEIALEDSPKGGLRVVLQIPV